MMDETCGRQAMRTRPLTKQERRVAKDAGRGLANTLAHRGRRGDEGSPGKLAGERGEESPHRRLAGPKPA